MNDTMWTKVLVYHDDYVVPGVIVFITSLIVAGNLCNIIVWCRYNRLAFVSRLLLVNMAISDLLVGGVACIPSAAASMLGTWRLGDMFCQISGLTHGTSVTLSIWTIALIGVDRYIAVTWPFRYHKLMSRNRAIAIVIMMWLLSLITFVAPIPLKTDYIYYRYSAYTKMCGLQWEYPVYCVVTGLYIPVLSGIDLCFTAVKIKKILLSGTESDNRRLTMNKRVYKKLILASMAFFICWGPYVTIVYIEAFSRYILNQYITFYAVWIANTNSCLNILIYSTTNKGYRNELVKLLGGCFCYACGGYRGRSSTGSTGKASRYAESGESRPPASTMEQPIKDEQPKQQEQQHQEQQIQQETDQQQQHPVSVISDTFEMVIKDI